MTGLAGKQLRVWRYQFTMGDIPVGFVAYRWYTLDIERIDLPNVRSLVRASVTERPGYREHIMIPLEVEPGRGERNQCRYSRTGFPIRRSSTGRR